MQVDSPNSRRGFLVNTFFSLISWFFPLCLAFVATPIIVRSLGNEQYGIYALFLGFLSFAFTTGVGRVTAKYIPEYRVSGDSERLAETLSATLWLSVSIGIVQAVILASATVFLVTDILLIEPGLRDIAVTSLYLASGAGLIMMVSQVFQSALHGQHRFDSYALLTNINGLMLAAGNIFLVWNRYDVIALAVWNLALTATFAVLFYFSARRHLPELRLLFHFPKEIFRSVSRYAGSIVIYQGLTSLLYAFERSWIVRTSGPEALTFYVIPMMLAIYMHGLLVNILYVIFPAANELLNDPERLITLYKRATRAALVLLVFIVTTYICTGRIFLHLWVGEDFASRSYSLLVIHSLTYAINAICIVVWMLAETYRAPGLNVLSTSLWVAAAIPLMVIAGGYWDIEGIALARLAGVLLTVPLIFYVEKKFFGQVFFKFWGGMLWRATVGAIAVVAVQRFTLSYIDGWAGLFIATAAGAGIFGTTLYLTGYLSREEIGTVRTALKAKVFGLR